MFNFIPNRLALIVLISACSIILISMGLRQTFGLFFDAFEKGLGVTRTEFGLAIGIQMLFWGFFAPIFGLLADKFGGNKAVFLGFLIFALGIFMLLASGFLFYTYYAGPYVEIIYLYLSIIAGIFGFLLLIKPNVILLAERKANKLYMTDAFFFKHRIIIGIGLLIASVFMVWTYFTVSF